MDRQRKVARTAGAGREDEEEFRSIDEGAHVESELRAVAQLAGGIAHDLNNLLGVIHGNADLALLDLGEDAAIRFELEEIRQASTRAAALANQLLAFSHRHVLQPRIVNLNGVIADDLGILRRLLGERIELELDLDPRLRRVKVDPGQFHQVLLNLVMNGRDAMPGGGRLRIRTRNARRALTEEGAPEGAPRERDRVCLSVTDHGGGIPPEVRGRIFEPFFSTKGVGQGTGLGLSIVCAVVEQLGGEIELETGAAGTTFYVYLPPVLEAPVPGDQEGRRLVVPRGSAGTILLVEDEDALRTLIRRILERDGYTVLDARSGEEALARAVGLRSPIDLLFADVILPGMSGKELAEELTPEQPGLRVLYMSGYSNDVIRSRGIPQGVDVLRKPASETDITSRVRSILEA